MNLRYAALIAVGLFAGSYFGARIMIALPPTVVRRIYAGFLFVVATRMLVMGK
jgi:uncharacterized membrane protein YfcA